MTFNAEQFAHELDRTALEALNSFPKIAKLCDYYAANIDERKERIFYLSSAVRLSDNQMPEIYSLLLPICQKLGIAVPDLFYVPSKELNAWTFGSIKPYICVTSTLVEKLTSQQIASVLAHECGHIACKHVTLHSLAKLLADGINDAVIAFLPGIQRFVTPTIIRALLFWERCSELSADRASVLCDDNLENTVSTLLRVHGYDEKINPSAFIQQAIDFHDSIEKSALDKWLEQIMIQGDTHPRLATRVYECYSWSHSETYQEILCGTYAGPERTENLAAGPEQEEVITAEIEIKAEPKGTEEAAAKDLGTSLDEALDAVNKELERYTSHADKGDYAFAIASGLITGFIDSAFIGEMNITDKDIGLSHKQVNVFIQEYAKRYNLEGQHLKNTIGNLEKAFPVLQDNTWKGAGIKITPSNHHLADLAHHPTPLGLAAAIAVQFLRIGVFVNKEGEIHFLPIETTEEDLKQIIPPIVITGALNWLVAIGEKAYKDEIGRELPEYVSKLAHIVASTPMLIEVAKCANNWLGHLVSDMGGSKQTAGAGMGIPGVFISLLYEIAMLPGFQESGLPMIVDNLYEKHKIDLRHEIPIYKAVGRQTLPVIFNEIYVRLSFFLAHLAEEISVHNGIKGVNWSRVIPFNNRTVDRMITVSAMTFTIADTIDASVHAAIESGGNWVLFSGKFVTRFNYAGAGRAAVAIVKEVTSERREAQLLKEKLILTEAKTMIVIEQLEEYKKALELKVSNYLAEDISEFMKGFDYIESGLSANDSDVVIKGNLVIQKVLGREPQFTNQEEFDELMESDTALVL